MTILDTDIAWAAGFIDGEGCLTLVKKRNGLQVVLNVSQVELAPLYKLKDLFGGSIQKHGKETDKWRAAYMWVITGINAASVIKLIRPYLLVKNKQADILMIYQELVVDTQKKNQYVLGNNDEDTIKVFKAEITKLNKRGPGIVA